MAKEFLITRIIDAPPRALWEAWTDEERFARWIVPDHTNIKRETVTFNVKPGGELSYTMVNPDTGQEFPTGGEYLLVDEPTKLSFSWGDAEDASQRAVITLTFDQLDDQQTSLDFHLDGFESEPGDGSIYDGWSQALDSLTHFVEGNPQPS